jgi:hypothetical protein
MSVKNGSIYQSVAADVKFVDLKEKVPRNGFILALNEKYSVFEHRDFIQNNESNMN